MEVGILNLEGGKRDYGNHATVEVCYLVHQLDAFLLLNPIANGTWPLLSTDELPSSANIC